MADYNLSLFVLPNLIVAAATLLWGLLLYWRDPDSPASPWAVAVAVSVALWQVAYGMGYIARTPGLAQRWIAFGQIGIIFIGPSLYEQLRRLLDLRGWRSRLSPLLWIAAAVELYLLLGADAFLGPPYHYAWGWYPHYRVGGTVLAAGLSATLIFLFVCCLLTWKDSPRDSGRRHRARLLLIGFCVSFTAAIDFLGCLGIAVYPFGYIMVGFTVVAVGYAAWRYRVIGVTSRAAAEQVLKTLSDGVLVLDDLGVVAVANERAALLLGRPVAELVGKTLTNVVPALTWREEPGDETELAFAGLDGAERILNVKADTLRNDDGSASLTVYALQDVTRYHEAADRIRELVYFDQATGLPNKRHLRDKLVESLERASPARIVAVCAMRVKHIRHLADVPGGSAADPVLHAIAVRLKTFTETSESGAVTAARTSSNEFVLLFSQVDSVGELTAQLNRLNTRLREPVTVDKRILRPALWLGVSLYPNDADDADALVERATAAMDQAAAIRTENTHFFNASANSAALRAQDLDSRLARAIEADELKPYFQPIINTDTGAIDYAEALVRWADPLRGVRMPDEFVPGAEESGLIVTLDRWMIHASCREAARWRGNGKDSAPRVAVNVSGVDLAASGRDDLVATVEAALKTSGLPPNRLEIEITETRAVTTDEAVLDKLRRLRALGVRITVDDFGTGYASLSYLQQFPLDALKVDASYVAAIGEDRKRTALLRSILVLAGQLGLEIVAEGVEAPHQAAFLRRYGCHLVQGFLFCRPLPAAEFVRFAESWTGRPDITLRVLSENRGRDAT
ncbi:MAG TPA: EAL domain-containing protein [Gammaproteobacteria bacterium]|nr:EAL domain-containing protein [Gammaproteobacteria bacterium]